MREGRPILRLENVNALAARFSDDVGRIGWVGPQAEPDLDGNLYAQAACGKHYGNYPPANIVGGDLPCPQGCASVSFATAA
jgi:hypothetical protein